MAHSEDMLWGLRWIWNDKRPSTPNPRACHLRMYARRPPGRFGHPPRLASRPALRKTTGGFVPAELTGQRCSDLWQVVEGTLRRSLGNACFSMDRAPAKSGTP